METIDLSKKVNQSVIVLHRYVTSVAYFRRMDDRPMVFQTSRSVTDRILKEYQLLSRNPLDSIVGWMHASYIPDGEILVGEVTDQVNEGKKIAVPILRFTNFPVAEATT